MKVLLAGIAATGSLIVADQARESGHLADNPAAAIAPGTPDWGEWTRPYAPAVPSTEATAGERTDKVDEIDVVDAHWMALTMWGEARGQGEAGMRAVGHVIHNRWLAKRHGAHVTDTVSAAWQFSCWNAGDPNRAAMLNIEALSRDSEDYRLWLAAKHVAAEILAGRSADPTGGALFYHTDAVQPAWSRGVPPVTRIGSHLFFRWAG
jgi:spore germination cell wall hydrolase CwlJ-like protein